MHKNVGLCGKMFKYNRDHCKRMWKGDYTFLSHQKRDSAETLVCLGL